MGRTPQRGFRQWSFGAWGRPTTLGAIPCTFTCSARPAATPTSRTAPYISRITGAWWCTAPTARACLATSRLTPSACVSTWRAETRSATSSNTISARMCIPSARRSSTSIILRRLKTSARPVTLLSRWTSPRLLSTSLTCTTTSLGTRRVAAGAALRFPLWRRLSALRRVTTTLTSPWIVRPLASTVTRRTLPVTGGISGAAFTTEAS
mmetsp:Transcript_56/g.207  ORF Transcript_56/g.207 Transcript_56/m.207 type:complete len:208 (+) Transcript_56:2290-2913(+)